MAKASVKPTTRRAVLSAGLVTAVAMPAAAALPTAAALAGLNLQPTELGRELLRRLPAYAEASWADCTTCDAKSAPGYDAAKAQAAEEGVNRAYERVRKAINAILERAAVAPFEHFADLAIAVRFCEEDGSPELWDNGVADTEYDEEGLLGGRAIEVLVGSLLTAAGVPERDCSLIALYSEVDRARKTAA